MNKKLDQVDPIEEQYFLEVTSPGVERVLKKPSEFEKFKGHKVQLKLFQPYEGQKMLTGNLLGLIDGSIVIENEIGVKIDIPQDKVSVTKLMVDFEDLGEDEEV